MYSLLFFEGSFKELFLTIFLAAFVTLSVVDNLVSSAAMAVKICLTNGSLSENVLFALLENS